jgi:hypothetical protein
MTCAKYSAGMSRVAFVRAVVVGPMKPYGGELQRSANAVATVRRNNHKSPREMTMAKTPYTYAVNDAIEAQIPAKIREAMNLHGWNALGIYELCRREIDKERKAKKRAQPQEGKP